jgi:hypothetical protein
MLHPDQHDINDSNVKFSIWPNFESGLYLVVCQLDYIQYECQP